MSKQCHLVGRKRKKIGELAQMEIWASRQLWAPFSPHSGPPLPSMRKQESSLKETAKNNLNQIKTPIVFPL